MWIMYLAFPSFPSLLPFLSFPCPIHFLPLSYPYPYIPPPSSYLLHSNFSLYLKYSISVALNIVHHTTPLILMLILHVIYPPTSPSSNTTSFSALDPPSIPQTPLLYSPQPSSTITITITPPLPISSLTHTLPPQHGDPFISLDSRL